MPFFDTHAHLDDKQFEQDLDKTIASFIGNNVNRVVCVATGIESSKRGYELSLKYPGVYFSAGIHPNSISDNPTNCLPLLDTLLADKKPIAVGEIGLDRYRNYSPFDQQLVIFTKQIELARKHNLPILIHCREAWDDLFPILESEFQARGEIQGILHSFTGTLKQAEYCLKLGLYLSFAGMITFKKNEALRAVAGSCPLDRLLIETDSPYLAPEPFRGKRNEPSYISYTAQCLAKTKGISLEALEIQLWTNSNRVFNLKA